MPKFLLRDWATPLTLGAFVLMGATGILMFFDQNVGLTTVIHQWFSWVFLVGVGAHLILHVRSLRKHIRSTIGQRNLILFGCILIASLFSWGKITGPQLKRPIEHAIVNTPLNALAPLAHTSSAELIARMAEKGIRTSGHETIEELAQQHHGSVHELLGLVFLH